MYSIKAYTKEYYQEVRSWWEKQNQIPPTEDMMPLDSTYMAFDGDRPAICISLYLTNIKEYCYLECYIGNPELKGNARKECTKMLLKYIIYVAKQKGYKKFVCLATKPELVRYYESMGFIKTLENVTTLCKAL